MCNLDTWVHKTCTDSVCLLSQVAIKSIRKERITDDLDRIHIQREIEITASLRHSNIIRFHEGKSANATQEHTSISLGVITFYFHRQADFFLSQCFRDSYMRQKVMQILYQRLTVQTVMLRNQSVNKYSLCVLMWLRILIFSIDPQRLLKTQSMRHIVETVTYFTSLCVTVPTPQKPSCCCKYLLAHGICS